MSKAINISSYKKLKRRDFIILSATTTFGLGVVSTLCPLFKSLSPSKEALAVSTTEVDISDIQRGQSIKVVWQGKPVFIRRRTPTELEKINAVNINTLRDPQIDKQRTKPGKEEWLVVVGVCTHLGCVPVNNSGPYNGWFCPCHGSIYDVSGRIRSGPAPLNLVIPPYTFLNNTTILIGKDHVAT